MGGGVKNFLKDNNDNTDQYGTKISEYIKNFSGYRTPFKKKDEFESLYFIWYAEIKEHSCKECIQRNNKIFKHGLNEEPPLHPNCHCVIKDYFKLETNKKIPLEKKFDTIHLNRKSKEIYKTELQNYLRYGIHFSIDDIYDFAIFNIFQAK